MANEVSASPTPELKFVDGKLHQLFVVSMDDGTSVPEFRPVPSETTEAPAGNDSVSGGSE